MINTFVCKKDGCNGNKFRVNTENDKILLTCVECGEQYTEDIREQHCKVLPVCGHCGTDIYKVFKDTEEDAVHIKCVECGNPPDKVYFDLDGNDIPYAQLKFTELQQTLNSLVSRVQKIEAQIVGISDQTLDMRESIEDIHQWAAAVKPRGK